MARRLRQVIDLYTTGRVVELVDGSPVWVQPLNPFEQDTARNEAQIARARLTLALRTHGEEEQAKVRMYFFEDGRDRAIAKISEARVAEAMPRLLDGIRNDPDWTERLTLMDRGSEDTAKPLEDGEQVVLAEIARDFATELSKRMDSERDFLDAKHEQFTDDELWAEYLEWYIERRAGEVTLAEYRLHQLYFGTRACDAVRGETETGWDHAECDHNERLFLDKAEVRSAPEDLQALLLDAFDDMDLTAREAKNSARQQSSSDSSPLPSEGEASTASTPTETRVAPPGSSSSPSPTPSPSSAGVS